MSLLSAPTKTSRPTFALPQCGACGLWSGCRSPKIKPRGSGNRRVLWLAESPGDVEDQQGIPLVGPAGKCLDRIVAPLPVKLDDCLVSNVVICHPPNNETQENHVECFVGSVMADSPSIQRAHRRKYSGTLIRVVTRGGRIITGTPNHPILTPLGWIPLGSLIKGQDLICGKWGEGIAPCDPHIQHKPTALRQIFDSLSKDGRMEWVDGGVMDFHGDGENSQVNIVTAELLLRNRTQSTSLQHLFQVVLEFANQLLCFLVVLGSIVQSFFECCRGLSLARQGSMGSSGKTCPTIWPFSFHSDSTGLAFTSGTNPKFSKVPLHPIKCYSEIAANVVKSFPGNVSLDSVLDIVRSSPNEFGHDVFNLQTKEGYYTADGIIVKNCCRPTVLKTIREFKPNVIILLGKFAIQSVIGAEWKDDLGEVGRWVGWQIPSKTFNAWLCPTYHPSFVLREDEDATLVKIVRSHIMSALLLENTPPYGWDLGKVDLLSGSEAIWALQKLDGMGQGNVAFDYETNCLKPDGSDSRIVCASFCHEGWTFAFPYETGVIHSGMSAVLRNPRLGKIGANCKFEERWTKRHFRHSVTDWVWDTVLAAHCADNRSHVTSVKFQAYVNGGINDYASGTKDYFESDGKRGGNSLNRIDEIPTEQLLQYCGWDSYVEWKLAEYQMERMGHARI